VAVAPAVTEVVPKPADWTGFNRSPTEAPPRFSRLLQEIQTGSGEVLYRSPGGTVTINDWVPAAAHVLALETVKLLLLDEYHAVDLSRTSEGVAIYEIKIGRLAETSAEEDDGDPVTPLPESALIAREVRDLSGLSAERLGQIFPVERESYQRWVSGKTTPSAANLERLLALRHFLRELANRVQTPKSWLLTPLSEGTSSGTPYEALKRGNLADLWDALAGLPSRARRYTREAADGTTLTVTEGSLRGRDIRTTPEELDDYDDWLGEDE